MGKSYLTVAFPPAYKTNAFYQWYRAGKPAMKKLMELLPPNEKGDRPNIQSLGFWYRQEQWELQAEALDDLVATELDRQVVSERVEMLRHHAEMGREMAEKGAAYLKSKGIESDSSAIRAIVEGTALERNNRGMAEAYFKIVNMTETELDKQIKSLLTGNEDKIIDATANSDEDASNEETDAG